MLFGSFSGLVPDDAEPEIGEVVVPLVVAPDVVAPDVLAAAPDLSSIGASVGVV